MDRVAAEWRVASTHKSATISTEGRPSGSSSDLVETRRGVAFAFARQGIYPMDSVAPKVGTQTQPNSRSHLRTSTREKGPSFESKNGPNFGAPKCFFLAPRVLFAATPPPRCLRALTSAATQRPIVTTWQLAARRRRESGQRLWTGGRRPRRARSRGVCKHEPFATKM